MLFTLILWGNTSFADDALGDSLVYHAYFGETQQVEQLLAKKADPNTKDEHGWPVIAVAADRSDGQAYDISKALIAAGADVNVARGSHYAIFNAIKHNNTKLVALLVAADADLNVKNADGLTVMAAARKTANAQTIDLLDKRIFEAIELQRFLLSIGHLKQLTSQYAFHHCAFQYWAYYHRSKQERDMDGEKIKNRARHHANAASKIGLLALQYFPQAYNQHYDVIAGKQRKHISGSLNELISNRNRRAMGVGEIKDLFKRCNLKKTPVYFHAVAAPY